MTLCRTSLNGLVHTSLILSGGASKLVIGHLRLPVALAFFGVSWRQYQTLILSPENSESIRKLLLYKHESTGVKIYYHWALARSLLRQKTLILTVSPRRRSSMISTLGLPSVFPNQLHRTFWTENWFPPTSGLLSSVMFVWIPFYTAPEASNF